MHPRSGGGDARRVSDATAQQPDGVPPDRVGHRFTETRL
jgi:hypothetical protein